MLLPRMASTALWLLLLVLVSSIDGFMHASERHHLQQQARRMFYHGYDSYMKHAYPWDELKPLSCQGRRWDQRERGDLDDVLGGFSLTLIDSLDMLAILGDQQEFARAVARVRDHVHFDRDVEVSVFESTIRVIGGLLSAHLLASSDHVGILLDSFDYQGELLDLAVDLGHRLLPAFDTPTGIPVHRINLVHGISSKSPTLTCPAAAGSLLVEMAYLSRLSGVPEFEQKAKQAVLALWYRRSQLDLLGSSIDVHSGQWVHSHVGIGAGLDSFFEYLLKYHIISGDDAFLEMFSKSYQAVEHHVNHDDLHIEVDMHFGRQQVRSWRVSALQAFWPGLQVLAGDVSSAMKSHARLFDLWNKFGAMPEIFDLSGEGSVISWAQYSPLRPELIESTYHLYQATRDHKYLKIGRKILQDIEAVSKVECGYAAIGNIHRLTVEDRMDSYFLSETVKYLYLLFSEDPDVIVPSFPVSGRNFSTEPFSNSSNFSTSGFVNATRPVKSSQVVFTTEGHLLLVDSTLFERSNSQQQPRYECENVQPLVRKGEVVSAVKRGLEMVGVALRLENQHVITVVASPATFGHQLSTNAVEAPLVFEDKALGLGCKPLTRQESKRVQGRVVVVTRGECPFSQKAFTLQRAGALALIVVNNRKHIGQRQYVITDEKDGLGSQVKIPLVMISKEDGARLRQELVIRANAEGDLDADVEFVHRDSESSGDDSLRPVVTLSPWLV